MTRIHAIRHLLWAGLALGLATASGGAFSQDEMAKAKDLTIKQCSQCHTFEKGEKHGQGPNLFGLIGREAAAAPGFVYSEGLKEAVKGKVWDEALLDQWLTDTLSVAPEAQMVYFQDDPKVRARLILYLKSLH